MLIWGFSNRMLTISFLTVVTGDKTQIYYWDVETAGFKYLGMMLTNQNCIHEEIRAD
jgi:hypothetical protein